MHPPRGRLRHTFLDASWVTFERSIENQRKKHAENWYFWRFFVENCQKWQKLGKNSILHRKVCDTWKYTNFGVLNSFLFLILWFEVFWRSYPHHFCEKRPDFDEFQSYPKASVIHEYVLFLGYWFYFWILFCDLK